MKPLPLLLAVSLLANAVLLALVTRAPTPPAPPSASAPPSTARSAGSADALRTALQSDDAAALEAAGLPPELARELTLGRSLVRAAERMRAARARQPANDRWWRTGPGLSPSSRELQLQARREFSEAFAAAGLGDVSPYALAESSEQLAFLSPEKRDALRRIAQDYDEMMAKFSAGGIQLPSDRERLKLLRAERDRDIAALLTPAELADYELRTSTSANTLRLRYGAAIETEEDFRQLYALQKAFDEKFPLDATTGRLSPDALRQRAEAARQLQDDIRAALGDDKFAALRRASDSDLRTVDSLVSRLNLPTQTTDRVAAARDTYAAESQRINADTSLPLPERRAQIQALGSRARAELNQSLGAEAAEIYAQRSPWVGLLQNGLAYTTTTPADAPGLALGGTPSVHPVPPAGAGGAGPNRQTFTIAAPLGTDAVTTDVGLLGGGAPTGGVRVMTFSTDSTTTTTPATSPGQRVLVTPPGTTPPPAAAQPKR